MWIFIEKRGRVDKVTGLNKCPTPPETNGRSWAYSHVSQSYTISYNIIKSIRNNQTFKRKTLLIFSLIWLNQTEHILEAVVMCQWFRLWLMQSFPALCLQLIQLLTRTQRVLLHTQPHTRQCSLTFFREWIRQVGCTGSFVKSPLGVAVCVLFLVCSALCHA